MQTSNYYKSIILDQCSSTNTFSSEKIKDGSITENSVVITFDQSEGKGKRDNKWESKKGKNITISLNYFPEQLTTDNSYVFYMISSISTIRVLREILNINVYSEESIDLEGGLVKINHLDNNNQDLKIKWPNDIFYKDQKLGGILTETVLEGKKIKSVVCGIGLNINQLDFETPHAISLANISKKEFDLEEIINKISVHFFTICNELFSNKISYNEVHSEYMSHLYYHLKPRFYKIEQETFIGTIVGISNEGQLIIKDLENNISRHAINDIEYV